MAPIIAEYNPDLNSQRIWEIGHYEKENPDALCQLGSSIGRVLSNAPDAPFDCRFELAAGKNIFGDSVASVGYIDTFLKGLRFKGHWRERHFSVAELAESTLAVGLYGSNRQYIDPEKLAKELDHPDLSAAMGQKVADLGMRLSPNQPIRIDPLSYEADRADDRLTFAPNTINLQGIIDYLAAQKSGGLVLGQHRLSESTPFTANSWTRLGREGSDLAVRFELEAFSADRSQPIQFVSGDGPNELVAVNKDSRQVKTPAALSGIRLVAEPVSPLVTKSHLLHHLEPAEDILFTPQRREEAEELNTTLRGIQELLIEQN